MEPVYLDYAATTPVRPEVREAMLPFLSDAFGNPSSLHRWGRAASAALEEARADVADALGAAAAEVRFVRGGTESDNLAIVGTCMSLAERGELSAILITVVEHHAVLEAARYAARRTGARLVSIPVGEGGTLDLAAADSSIQGRGLVASAMWVNNETGMVLPVPEFAAWAKSRGATVHTDAVQAVGKIPVDVNEAQVDLLSITGHKIYGPKGTGALYVRSGTVMEPLLHGGGQERALRPGTEDVAGAVGLATALRLVVEERDSEARRLAELRHRLEAGLRSQVEGTRVNGEQSARAPHIASIGIQGVDGQALLMALDLDGLAVSGGSACASGSDQGSHVLRALYGPDDPYATVRFSLGRSTTAEHVDRATSTTASVVGRLRAT